MPIIKKKSTPEVIEKITCDGCGDEIPLNFIRHPEDHLVISGTIKNKIAEAVICTKCMAKYLGFINIQYKESTIGHC